MNQQETEALLRRVEAAEAELREIKRRLLHIEPQAELATRSVQDVPVPPPVEVGAPPAPTEVLREVPETASATQHVNEVEYAIGLQGLLRGGAVIVVVALVGLVGLGISNRWISREVQFIGELLLCAAFFGVGWWKRNENEQFGQLLTGVGSCGLYLSFAAAHVFKGVISDTALVASFVLLSLANLGYAFRFASQAFLIIGFGGGLIAATMPMRSGLAELDLALLALVTIATTVVIRRHKWILMASLIWLGNTLALIPPIGFGQTEWGLQLFAIYGFTLLSAWLYSDVSEANDIDLEATFLVAILVVAGLAGLAVSAVSIGRVAPIYSSFAVLAFSGLTAGLASLTGRGDASRAALMNGAALIALCVAPAGLWPMPAQFIYAGLAVGLALVRTERNLNHVANLACTVTVLAFLCELTRALERVNASADALGVIALIAATVAAGYAKFRAGHAAKSVGALTALVCMPLFMWLVALVVTDWIPGARVEISTLFAGLVYAWGLIEWGNRKQWRDFNSLGYASVFVSFIAYASVVRELSVTSEVGIVTTYILAIVFFANAVWRTATEAQDRECIAIVASTLLNCFIVRLAILTIGGSDDGAAALGLLLTTAIGSGFALWQRLNWLLVSAFLQLTFAGALALNGPIASEKPPLLVLSIAGFGWLAFVSHRVWKQQQAALSYCVAGGWFLLSHLAWIAAPLALTPNAALTGVWITFAITLIALGFRLQLRTLRFWSFAVFGLTILKVFFVDTAGLDPIVRVLLSLALGISMLGGGYVYIRNKPAPEPRPLSGESEGAATIPKAEGESEPENVRASDTL